MRRIDAQTIINTTPRDVMLYTPEGETVMVATDLGHQLRLSQPAAKQRADLLLCDGSSMPIFDAPLLEGPIYELLDEVVLVSMPVGDFIRAHRNEGFEKMVVLGPDTGAGAVRDAHGDIIGTRRFVMY